MSLSISMLTSSALVDAEVFRRLKELVDSFVGRLLLPVGEDLERRRGEPFADFWPPFMQFTSIGKCIIIEFEDLTANISNIWSSTESQLDLEIQSLTDEDIISKNHSVNQFDCKCMKPIKKKS